MLSLWESVLHLQRSGAARVVSLLTMASCAMQTSTPAQQMCLLLATYCVGQMACSKTSNPQCALNIGPMLPNKVQLLPKTCWPPCATNQCSRIPLCHFSGVISSTLGFNFLVARLLHQQLMLWQAVLQMADGAPCSARMIV